ncbi:MAG: HD domain-containing protein [Planctomycetaceae bacterium]
MSEFVARARQWAIEKHGDQQYGKGPDAKPYAYHLGAVAAIAAPYGELAEGVAWLHDVVEDTNVDEAMVAAEFGEQVARMVGFVTNPPSRDKVEKIRLRDAKLAGLLGDDQIALIVKDADRLANLRESMKPGETSEKMLAQYRGEHPGLRAAAFWHGLCDAIWAEIDGIVGPDVNG